MASVVGCVSKNRFLMTSTLSQLVQYINLTEYLLKITSTRKFTVSQKPQSKVIPVNYLSFSHHENKHRHEKKQHLGVLTQICFY